ncbi:hypothetical protein SEMRO_3956_G352160.1 [Seminavis robusta]|uniref:Uncharacterized protein n=1 Tax=Seminavis robusta TaxID=568900 RepID=A0A9N8F521_9STRA|nr:hypothetical protein SEMRO_3956_G352160.1 [Seminavis robusta]|eukprot:Sro3956_g352160.1 n/a (117) ;mRNA; r:2325-2675
MRGITSTDKSGNKPKELINREGNSEGLTNGVGKIPNNNGVSIVKGDDHGTVEDSNLGIPDASKLGSIAGIPSTCWRWWLFMPGWRVRRRRAEVVSSVPRARENVWTGPFFPRRRES